MANNLDKLNNLSEKEKETALEILKQISKAGSSTIYNELLYSDYKEIPVTIEEFLHNPRYLGKALTNEEGKFTIFPYWEELLKEIYPNNLDPPRYNTLALTGGIGLGKSTIAVICILYDLYRMLCLKDPYLHYGLQPIDLITFAVLNITLDAAKGVAWDKIQSMLQASEWFLEHGTLSKSDPPTWKPPKGVELIYGSQPRHILGRAVFGCFIDEISFQIHSDINEQIKKAKTIVSAAATRMQSRFMKGNKNPTLLIIASSKRTDYSFMETFIAKKKKEESKTTRVVDEPQWVIRTDKDSPQKFKVALGNKFMPSELLPLDVNTETVNSYINKGYQIIDIPIGYLENFKDDLDSALMDIAGISVSSISRYIAGDRLESVKDFSIRNPFTKEILEVGNAPDDTAQYYDFFDISLVNKKNMEKPLFIHLDMSISGDKTGIGGVWITGFKKNETNDYSKELIFETAFAVSIKAPKGRQISFEKNRNFIYWLKEQGFKIKGISYDTFQSYDLGQTLTAKGYPCSIISVDKVENKVCKPYQFFRSVIYELRIKLFEHRLLTQEILGLERDNNTGKVDHSPNGINSKDCSDAVCLHPDTKIFLLSGKAKTIKDLYDNGYDNEWVLSYNIDTHRIEPTKIIKVINNGYKNNLLKLYLDNGDYLICTEDHKILARNGSYIAAKDCLNISLMPFTFENKLMYKERDYCYVYNPNEDLTTSGIYLHKLVAENILIEDRLYKQKICKDKEWVVIHHKDCNRFNNNPDNLEYLTNYEHYKKHSNLNSSEYKKELLRQANRKKVELGIHPFQLMSKEQHSINGKNSLIRYNQSEQHRLSTSKRNKELAKDGKLSLQLKKENAHTKFANEKRDKTCLKKYGGTGFKSDIIQKKCRESCLKNNGYDNPFHSKTKQNQMKLSKLLKAYEKVLNYYSLSKNDTISLLDFKIACYALNLSGISSIDKDIKELNLNINCSNFDENLYKKLRTKGNCVKLFLKTLDRNEFTYEEFSAFYDKQYNMSSTIDSNSFKYRFKDKPSYNDILKLGFNLYNHKVIKIEQAESTEVYDIKLDKIHNFALNCGIFVHNCGAIYNASQHGEEYEFEYGETLELMLDSNSDISKEQITIDLKSELDKIFNPIPQNKKVDDDSQSFIAVNDGILLW